MSFTLTNISNGYAEVTPTLIPNTTMRARLNDDNSIKLFRISAIDGYVLHDSSSDGIDPDTEELVYRYAGGECSCGANYDFSTTEMTVPDINGNMVVVTAYGSRQFFAFPENLVPDPENNIYGGGNDNAAVMSVEEAPEND